VLACQLAQESVKFVHAAAEIGPVVACRLQLFDDERHAWDLQAELVALGHRLAQRGVRRKGAIERLNETP
jgi:hypothetical protein